MPFIDSSRSFKSRLQLSRISTPVLIGIVVLVLLACILAVQNAFGFIGTADFSIESDAEAAESAEDDEASDDATASEVVVFVSGAVSEAGVYSLPEGSRVQDAILLAGGFTEDASQDALNLARVLQDGEQIAVPTAEEVESGTVSAESTLSSDSSSSTSGLININSATSEELQTLPGIGEVTAQKIIDSRESEGPFSSKEDLKRVSGIGDKKYEAVEDLITV